jgi:hypothetical protein
MAERLCPRCTKRPVWRTKQSNYWEYVCKRCYHKAWATTRKPSTKHGVRPGTRETPPRPTCRTGSMGPWRAPRDVGGLAAWR